MIEPISWSERFGAAEYGLMQERPYPVVSPSTVEALAEIVQECSERNWRVLPLGHGSSFPENFSLKTERTFAIATSKLRELSRLSNGRMFCHPGASVQKVLLTEAPIQRKTIGGLICGSGDLVTREAARNFWHRVYCVELIDSKGRTVVQAGPASPQYFLSASASLLLESRGKAGILVGIEFCGDELPLDLGRRSLLASGTESLSSPISRQVSYRGADALSLFDW